METVSSIHKTFNTRYVFPTPINVPTHQTVLSSILPLSYLELTQTPQVKGLNPRRLPQLEISFTSSGSPDYPLLPDSYRSIPMTPAQA